MLKDLGADIRMMRKELGLTQEQLAEELDINATQLSRYENGTTEMGANAYRRLRDLYEEKRDQGRNEILQLWEKLNKENQHRIEDLMLMMAKVQSCE